MEDDSRSDKPAPVPSGMPIPIPTRLVSPFPINRALEDNAFITPELFETWMRAPAAYDELLDHYGDSDIAITTIFRRVTNGLLRVAAELAVWKENGQTRRDHYWLVTPELWTIMYPGPYAHLWRNGEIDELLAQRPGGYVTRDDPTVTLIDVRFEPSGIHKMIGRDTPNLMPHTKHLSQHPTSAPGTLATHPSTAPEMPTKPLPANEYRNASRAVVAGWGTGLTEMQAWEMAKRMFPDRAVSRDTFLAQYRIDRGPKKRGKPTLRG